jgi:hypothetical protein
MRRLLVGAVAAAIIAVPTGALAYPPGGCAAPQNWPAEAADNYRRICGVSVSDALAGKTAKPPQTSSPAGPVAASVGVFGAATGAVLFLRRRARVKR